MIEIRKATSKDVPQIVDIHLDAFPDFFLSSLGEGFLKMYYKCFCTNKDAVTLCSIEDGRVVGFSATALKSSGFNSRLIKEDLFGFSRIALNLLLTNPKSLLHLAKNMTKSNKNVIDDGCYAELFSIGVSPDCQGKGIGSMLLIETERLVQQRGG